MYIYSVHYVIVGCGRVGRKLTEYLLNHGHSVAAIDINPDRFRKLPRHENLTTLVGIGFDRNILQSAHIERADGLAAVVTDDNANIVIARVAKEIFHVPHVTARIFDSTKANLFQRLGISTVASVTWSTDQFIKRIAPENDTSDWVDPTGNVVIVERLLPSHWAGKTFAPLFEPEKYTLIAVSHIGNTNVASPKTKAHEDDRVFIACNKECLEELDELLQKGPRS